MAGHRLGGQAVTGRLGRPAISSSTARAWPGDEPRRRDVPHQAHPPVAALVHRRLHGRHGQRPVAGEDDVHLARAEGARRGDRAVQHEVRTCACQRTVLAARRLALAEVDHDDRPPRALGRGAQLDREGERRPAAAAQPDVVDGGDEVVESEPRELAVLLAVRAE